MIFLAVGTQFPFDRLVKAIDDCLESGIIDEEIFGQIGETSYRPRNFRATDFLDKKEFDRTLIKATRVIGHAGIGVIRTAMENDKPLLVMPRLKKYREVVHDHQVGIARKFEKHGHILVAYCESELCEKAKELKYFKPSRREAQIDAVSRRISMFLEQNNESAN